MRISELLLKNAFEITAGGFLSRFRIRKRRDTFFFEEIASEYVRRCDAAGHRAAMESIGHEWMTLFFRSLVSERMLSMPKGLLLNVVMRNIWMSGGLMDDFHATVRGDRLRIDTVNEGMTRAIGPNGLMEGFYHGIAEALFGSAAETLKARQTKTTCSYEFRFTKKPPKLPPSREKAVYDSMNRIEATSGVNIKDLLEKNVFRLRGNSMYFRGMRVAPVENTLFHLMGNRGIMLGEVEKISREAFIHNVRKDSSERERLALLKNLLHAMGWGAVSIILDEGKGATFDIRNPHYGLQPGRDSWEFMARTILGYMQVTRRDARMKRIDESHRHLRIEYLF